MKVVLLLLLGIATIAPATAEDKIQPEVEVLTEEWFSEQYKKYTSEHDIVNIFIPTKPLKVGGEERVPLLFFVEGDYKEDGKIDYKGLYALKIKTGQVTKLLDNGVDFTGVFKDDKVFFAATDGIYTYNAVKGTAEKYGSITDNIISIATAKTEAIYILTAEKVLYKVTENGEKKEKVDAVRNAQKIVIDEKENIYFYDSEKCLYVLNKNRVIKVEGVPVNPKKITLLPLIEVSLFEKAIPALIDDRYYNIDENGIAVVKPVKVVLQPTAIALGPRGNYFGYNKSIYESLR